MEMVEQRKLKHHEEEDKHNEETSHFCLILFMLYSRTHTTHTHTKKSSKSLERENNNLIYNMYRKKIKHIQQLTWKVQLVELELLADLIISSAAEEKNQDVSDC